MIYAKNLYRTYNMHTYHHNELYALLAHIHNFQCCYKLFTLRSDVVRIEIHRKRTPSPALVELTEDILQICRLRTKS